MKHIEETGQGVSIVSKWFEQKHYLLVNVINKIKKKLKFPHRKNRFLTPALRLLICNAFIQPYFDYGCSAWYPNQTKKIKNRIQTTENKCMHLSLQLDKLKHISHEEFERLNWLLMSYRLNHVSTRFCLKT